MRSAALSLVSALLLGGCASIDEQLEAPVDEVLHSEKSASAVANCLLEHNTGTLEEYNYGEYTDGVTLSFVVSREGSGSKIEVRNTGVVPGFYHSDTCL